MTPISFATYRENNPHWRKVSESVERNLSSWEYLSEPRPAPVTPVPYVPDFLTKDEHDSLFSACADIPFAITKTRWGKDVKHSSMTYAPEGYEMRHGYNGDFCSLKYAPDAIKMLQQKLSDYAGKTIDYLSVVRYQNGDEGMTWHQHSEDRHGGDMSVWIVRTGAERTLSIRKNEKGSEISHMLMGLGSLAVLPSEFNDTHLHKVSPYKGAGMCYSINCKVLPTPEPNGLRKPQVFDCHAGKKYPDDAVYMGCRTKDRSGNLLREGSVFGNAVRPLECRDKRTNPAITHDNEPVFRAYALDKMKDPDFAQQVESLRGKDLLCWCKDTAKFCHARVWLELANPVEPAMEPVTPTPTPNTGINKAIFDGRTYFAEKPKASKECWDALTPEERAKFEGHVDQNGVAVKAYSMFRFINYERRKGSRTIKAVEPVEPVTEPA
jgi:uncharacterized Zn-finger protein